MVGAGIIAAEASKDLLQLMETASIPGGLDAARPRRDSE